MVMISTTTKQFRATVLPSECQHLWFGGDSGRGNLFLAVGVVRTPINSVEVHLDNNRAPEDFSHERSKSDKVATLISRCAIVAKHQFLEEICPQPP